jgi:hypothetical protein
MQYSRLLWNHPPSTEPVEILSEYDESGWEKRKVERFLDGSIGYASTSESAGGTRLSLIQRPSDDEVVAEPEFSVFELSKEEFERVWADVQKRPRKLKRVS